MSGPHSVAVVDIDGWRIKTYWVSSTASERPRANLIAAARRRAAETLPDRPDRVGAFGVGFLVVHLADDHLLAQVNWWVRPDELHQRAFVSPPGAPHVLEPSLTAAIGGVSELMIAAHEGGAWMRHVIANLAGPDIDAYLADSYTPDRLHVTAR
jgi:hypothetical protein